MTKTHHFNTFVEQKGKKQCGSLSNLTSFLIQASNKGCDRALRQNTEIKMQDVML